MSNECYLCGGLSYWTLGDGSRISCPLCATLLERSGDGWLPYLPRMANQYYGGPLIRPWLLVIHSGAVGRGVAEYLSAFDSEERRRRGTAVSCHLNWSVTHNGFAQGVSLQRIAYHCGGSSIRLRGHGKLGSLNTCSIGIELPGPWFQEMRSPTEMAKLREAVKIAIAYHPTLRVVARHSDIDHRKKDPGPGFSWEWLDDLGLLFPFRQG